MKVLIWITCIGLPIMVSAIEPFNATPEEMQMCETRVFRRNHGPNDKPGDWAWQHHHCDGLRFYERAVRTRNNSEDFRYNIQLSLGGFEDVLKRTSPDFSMRSELMVLQGRTMELAGQGLEAAQLYITAIQIDPKFPMAYAALGNFYAKSGNIEQALKTYTEGLRRRPNNKYLRSRYTALGGEKLPAQVK